MVNTSVNSSLEVRRGWAVFVFGRMLEDVIAIPASKHEVEFSSYDLCSNRKSSKKIYWTIVEDIPSLAP